MKNTKYLALGLAGVITFTPMASLAVKDNILTNGDKQVIAEKLETVAYMEYKGKITDVEKDTEKNNLSILVEGSDKKLQEKMVFHIREDMTIVDEKSKEFIERDDLKEGSQVSVFFKENTPMTMSIPAQLSPDAIVVNNTEDTGFVKIAHFNSELVDSDNQLKLNITDETVIVDSKGEKLEKDKLANKNLMVFYTISTRSIPAQTSPEKIIVLDDMKIIETPDKDGVDETEEMITVMDKLVIDGKELELDHEIYKSVEGNYMLALRPVGEALGYKVSWNNQERSVELIKGAQYTKITIGSTNYNFAKMLVKLDKAPEIKDSKTYVPVEFLEEVLKLDLEVNNGVLQVK